MTQNNMSEFEALVFKMFKLVSKKIDFDWQPQVNISKDNEFYALRVRVGCQSPKTNVCYFVAFDSTVDSLENNYFLHNNNQDHTYMGQLEIVVHLRGAENFPICHINLDRSDHFFLEVKKFDAKFEKLISNS